MEIERQIAGAPKGGKGLSQYNGVAQSVLPCDQGKFVSANHHPFNRVLGQGMFVEAPKRKILCSCGAIAEVDSAMVSTKNDLGKTVECRVCRNKRIARELDEIDRHFNGGDDEEQDW